MNRRHLRPRQFRPACRPNSAPGGRFYGDLHREADGPDMSLATGLEIERMVHHGLTPAEALVAATSTAAVRSAWTSTSAPWPRVSWPI